MECPRCGLSWVGCSCTDEQVRKESRERDYDRDFGFHTWEQDHAEEYLNTRYDKEEGR